MATYIRVPAKASIPCVVQKEQRSSYKFGTLSHLKNRTQKQQGAHIAASIHHVFRNKIKQYIIANQLNDKHRKQLGTIIKSTLLEVVGLVDKT